VVRVSLFVWLLPLDLTGKGGPTSSYATAGIALRVSGALKWRYHWWGTKLHGITAKKTVIFTVSAMRTSN
jgi:hypothetical protein